MATTDSPGYVLDISESLFRLTTEGVRLRSNETLAYETISSLISHRTAQLEGGIRQKSAIIREHLSCIPTDGEIKLRLDICRTSASTLDDIKDMLSQQLGSALTLGDALSILLFDYVAERKAARVLEKIGLDGTNGQQQRRSRLGDAN